VALGVNRDINVEALVAPQARRSQALAPVPDWGNNNQQPLVPRRPPVKTAEPEGMVNIWMVIKKRMWLILAMLLISISGAYLYTKSQPKIYRSTITLEIQDTNNDLLNTRDLDPHAPAATQSSETYMMTQVELMRSSSLLTRVLTRLLLDRQVSQMGKPQVPLSVWGVPDSAGQESLQHMVAKAKLNIQARVISNTRVVELSGEAEDPQFIADFLNLLGKEFINRGLEVRGAAGRLNNMRLGSELEGLRNKLQISEQRLRDYAKQTGLLITDEKENLAEQKLRQVQEELSRAQAARVSKQALYEMTAGATPDALPQVLNDSTMREYQSKISELQRQYADQNVSLTAEHPSVQRLQAQLAELRASRDRHLGRVVDSIKNDYEGAVRREKLLSGDYESQSSVVLDQGPKAINYQMLKREVDTNRALYDSILQKVKEYGIANAMHTSNVQIVDEAFAPTYPYRPSLGINLAIGLLAGGLIGLVSAVLLERSDSSLHEPGDIANHVGGVELGVIPSWTVEKSLGTRLSAALGRPFKRIGEAGDRISESMPSALGSKSLATTNDTKAVLKTGLVDSPELVVWNDKFSRIADSFRYVITSILLAQEQDRPTRVIMVTSAGPREGKTTVCCNLGLAVAELNLRVLLIDGDLRAPRLQEVFKLRKSKGLADLLLEEDLRVLKNIVMSGAPNLHVLPAGRERMNEAFSFTPAHTARMIELLRSVRQEFDVILIDTPPILYLQDARVIGRLCDAAILVARAGHTTAEQMRACHSRMHEDRVPLIGTILNDWKPSYGAYGDKSGYTRFGRYYNQERNN